MFNIGGGELLVIFLVALIVLGPDKLPDAARKVGGFMGEMRKMSQGFRSELEGAMKDPTEPLIKGPAARRSGPPTDAKPIDGPTADGAPAPTKPVEPVGGDVPPTNGAAADESTGS